MRSSLAAAQHMQLSWQLGEHAALVWIAPTSRTTSQQLALSACAHAQQQSVMRPCSRLRPTVILLARVMLAEHSRQQWQAAHLQGGICWLCYQPCLPVPQPP